ncbi:MAG TPA: T9SS type A sorting domain-containing protein [Bacteroidia bacterium]|nr:T9SS type A sorting domain-containing protein [Bacteroidia bacterium]
MKTKNLLFYIVLLVTAALLMSPASTFAQTIAAGYAHSLSVCNNNSAMAWGYNYEGELGIGNNISNYNYPVTVSSLSGAISIAGGYEHSIALKNDSTVWAWGGNVNGQLGNGNNINSNIPVQVSSLAGITAIAGGGYHSLALQNDSTVWTWGNNSSGQLGNGTTGGSNNVPIQVTGLTGVIAIAGGGAHSLALKNDGTVWAWGFNSYGALGNGTNTDSNIPIQVSSLTGITVIAGGGVSSHSIALKNDGTVWAWGYNGSGELGNGTLNDSNVPVQISSLTGITAIAGGGAHSLVLKSDGTVWACGENSNGALGNGTNTSSLIPVQVSSLTSITAIAGGFHHSLALKNDGTTWAWGYNLFGQLGDSNYIDSNIPVQITGLCSVATEVNEITEPKLSVSIFPNPSNGEFTIDLKRMLNPSSDGQRVISIYNMLGEKVYSTIINQQSSIINLNMPSGIYFLNLKTENNSISQKLIIQK